MLKEHGGSVSDKTSVEGGTTHVLVEGGPPDERVLLRRAADAESHPAVAFVNRDWATACLRAKKRLPEDPFVIRDWGVDGLAAFGGAGADAAGPLAPPCPDSPARSPVSQNDPDVAPLPAVGGLEGEAWQGAAGGATGPVRAAPAPALPAAGAVARTAEEECDEDGAQRSLNILRAVWVRRVLGEDWGARGGGEGGAGGRALLA